MNKNLLTYMIEYFTQKYPNPQTAQCAMIENKVWFAIQFNIATERFNRLTEGMHGYDKSIYDDFITEHFSVIYPPKKVNFSKKSKLINN